MNIVRFPIEIDTFFTSFRVNMNLDHDHMKQIHQSCIGRFGFNISDLTSDSYDGYMTSKSECIRTKLMDLGILKNAVRSYTKYFGCENEFNNIYEYMTSVEEYSFFDNDSHNHDGISMLLFVWLGILQHIEPNFKYEILDNEPLFVDEPFAF